MSFFFIRSVFWSQLWGLWLEALVVRTCSVPQVCVRLHPPVGPLSGLFGSLHLQVGLCGGGGGAVRVTVVLLVARRWLPLAAAGPRGGAHVAAAVEVVRVVVVTWQR